MDEIKPWKKHDYLWFAWHRLTSSPHAATTPNIQAGFCAAGIFPFNWDIFGEHEYLPSDVTDRPLDQVIPVPQQPRASAVQSSSSAVTDQAIPVPQQPSMPATSLSAVTEVTSLSVVTVPTCLDDALSTPTTFTPESVRPFPKAGPQIGRLNNCIKRKTTKILTVKWNFGTGARKKEESDKEIAETEEKCQQTSIEENSQSIKKCPQSHFKQDDIWQISVLHFTVCVKWHPYCVQGYRTKWWTVVQMYIMWVFGAYWLQWRWHSQGLCVQLLQWWLWIIFMNNFWFL